MIADLVFPADGLGRRRGLRLVQFRSPAPPLIALVGLLGMVLGECAVDDGKAPSYDALFETTMRKAPGDVVN